MQIYDTLKKEHQELRQLLDRLITAGEENTRSELISQVRDALVPHARAEEAVFYNSLREFDRAKEKIGHSFKEHMKAETLLRTMQVKEKIAANWEKSARDLKEAIEHHIAEEEGEIFGYARQFFTEQEATMMNDAFLKLKGEAKEAGFMKNSMDLVVNLMPPRFTNRFREFGTKEQAS